MAGFEEGDAENSREGGGFGSVASDGTELEGVQHIDADVAEYYYVFQRDVQREDEYVGHMEGREAGGQAVPLGGCGEDADQTH